MNAVRMIVRVLVTAVVGMLTFLFVALDLVLLGLVPVQSALVEILPTVGAVVGVVIGVRARLAKAARRETVFSKNVI